MTLVLIIILALVAAAVSGFLLALWSIQSGYLNLFDSPRERQLLLEQLRTLTSAQQLNMQAWQARSQLLDEAWRNGQ